MEPRLKKTILVANNKDKTFKTFEMDASRDDWMSRGAGGTATG